MRYISAAPLAASVLLVLAGSAVFLTSSVSAQTVQLLVCPQQPESYAFISKPLSDTVVDTPVLALEGNVLSISQIDVYIDDAYDSTVALGVGETSFATKITLEQGTHTVKIVAQDNCSQTTHEDGAVVTYIPRVVPGLGSDATTAVSDGKRNGTPTGAMESTGDDQGISSDRAESPKKTGPGLRLPAVVETLLGSMDIGTGNGQGMSMSDVLKPAAVLAGIVTALALPSLLERGKLDPLLNWLWYRPKGLQPRKLKRVDPARSRAIRLIGAVLIIVPFIV